MSATWLALAPLLAPVLALGAALLLRAAQPQRPGAAGVVATLMQCCFLAPLALAIAIPDTLTPLRIALLAALALALLARDREDILQSECALKLTWVLAAAFALSWAGESLLTLAAGTATTTEQWPALALQLDPYGLWSAALAMTLIAGLVLLGGAPFHFWLADVAHGTRASLAPLIATGLQVSGAALLVQRLHGVDAFAQAASLVRGHLTIACVLALLGGAATVATAKRPERRVGLLASLQGALLLASLIATSDASALPLMRWGAHLALAMTGALALAHFLPVAAAPDAPAAALFRRHPYSGVAGAYAMLSLAGAPGTPGMSLWLQVARALVRTHHPGLLLALVVAWITAFSVAATTVRAAFGSPSTAPMPERAVPWPARAALWACAAGLAAMAFGVLGR